MDYVLAKVNSVLLRPVERGEICGVFAGLRPLVAADEGVDTTTLSREHRLFWPAPGLTAIAGGKYTTYRVMARDAVDARGARPRLDGALDHRTRAARRRSAAGRPRPASPAPRRLCGRGATAGGVRPRVEDPARPGAGYLTAEAVHAVTHQGALDLDDILSRRTRVSIEAPDRGRAAATAIAPLVAPHLGWSEARAADEVDRYLRLRDAEEAAEAAPDDAAAAAAYRALAPSRAPGP